jgi:type IV secretory pathway TrbD component
MERRVNPVFRSLNRPLTLMGAERKLFFFALMMGAGVFNLLHTFLGGILMFCLLYAFAR